MSQNEHAKSVWWGTYALEQERAGRWHIGPSTVWIYHGRREWRLICTQMHDPLADAAEVTLPIPDEEAEQVLEAAPDEATVSRYSFHHTDEQLHLHPALADREIVIRPEMSLYVLAGEEVTLYVSTPLWLRIEVGASPRLLQEVPSYRPSDTWFGPSTREGELCYASRTVGRLRLDRLPFRLHRAVTPVLVRNKASDSLLLDRLKLPVQYLSLYQASNNFLWTQAVTLEREEHGDVAALKLGEKAPPEAEDAHLVRGPRQESKTNLVVRTFGTLFHLHRW